MKSVLITFDQAYYERIMALLDLPWLYIFGKGAGTWFKDR